MCVFVVVIFSNCVSVFLKKDISLEENMRLKDALQLDEQNAHQSVKLLLRKYERFRVMLVTCFISVCCSWSLQC